MLLVGRMLVLAAVLLLAVGRVATAQAELQLWMTTVVPETTEVFQGIAKAFATKVQELSGGKVMITPYPVGVIAPLPQVYDAVLDGLVELGHAPVPLLTNRDPATALFSSYPGGMGSDAMIHWMYHGGGYQLLVEHHHTTLGLHPLVVGFATTELFAHSHRCIRKLDDFKGLKFRALGVFGDILRELGAVPTSTPQAEIATALQQRTIDAAEFLSPADNLKLGFNKLAPYVVAPGAHLPGGYFTVFMTLERWEGLSPEIRTALERAAELTTFEFYYAQGKRDLDAMAQLSRTNEICRLEPEVLTAIRDQGRAWVQRQVTAHPDNPWIERVAKAHFDFQDLWDAWGWYRL
jgi:TRAP-type mannitol/chloroaromatic compound transport system substrate-binding protein